MLDQRQRRSVDLFGCLRFDLIFASASELGRVEMEAEPSVRMTCIIELK